MLAALSQVEKRGIAQRGAMNEPPARLSELLENDPRNLLSHEARLRISAAVRERTAAIETALAMVEARGGDPYDAETKWDVSSRAEFSGTKMDTAKRALAVVLQEFAATGVCGDELEEIMRGELDGISNSSPGLSDRERLAVWAQLRTVRTDTATLPPKAVTISDEQLPSTKKRIESFLDDVGRIVGRRVTKTELWKAARYGDETEFERFQRDDPRTTHSARRSFENLLSMTPEDFAISHLGSVRK